MRKLIFIGLVFLLSGCSQFLKEYSQDLVVAKSVEDYDELLLGSVYMPSYKYGGNDALARSMPSGFVSCGFFNILDDDINTVKANKITYLNTWRNTVKPCFGYFCWQLEVGRNLDGNYLASDHTTWNDLYSRISIVNVILEEIDDISTSTVHEELDKERIKGECYFLRAQFYWVLVNLYGDPYEKVNATTKLGVPLKLTGYVEHEKDKPTQFSRNTISEIYEQVIADLNSSVVCLTKSPQKQSLHRVSAAAAQLLLSRVYLYKQDWENARSASKSFLEIAPSLTDMTIMDDNTSIFITEERSEILFSQGSQTMQAVLKGFAGDFCVSEDLYNLYDEDKDKRASIFFQLTSDSIALKNKFKMGEYQSHTSDVLMLRATEGYLNMAEACAMLDDADANYWLNAVRRLRIVDYQDQVYSGAELMNQIRLERRKEFCFEGHRWFDLRRYAVNEKYPYKKQIRHLFNIYDDNISGAPYNYGQGYILEENDLAYTFAIPKKVLEFDLISMPDNPRSQRLISWKTFWGDENEYVQ